MAQKTVKLFPTAPRTITNLGDPSGNVGDVHATEAFQFLGNLAAFTQGQIGSNTNGAQDSRGFYRFDITTLPQGWELLKWRFGFTLISVNGARTRYGSIRLGFDTLWEQEGFPGQLPTPRYSVQDNLPHPSPGLSDTIRPGVLALDRYFAPTSGDGFTDLQAASPGGLIVIWNGYTPAEVTAFGASITDEQTNISRFILQNQVLSGDAPAIAIVAVGFVGTGMFDFHYTTHMAEASVSQSLHPFLEFVFEENPPTITSAPGSNTATIGTPYAAHTVTATDPTDQDITFSVNDSPPGLQIHPTTGVITWTPFTLSGSRTVRVRATDTDGLFDEQTWTIDTLNDPREPGQMVSEEFLEPRVDAGTLFSAKIEAPATLEPRVQAEASVGRRVDAETIVEPRVESEPDLTGEQ